MQALFGFESRTEKANFNSGFGAATRIAYEAGGSGDGSQGGQFDSDDFYMEARVPLVSSDMNIPGVQNLELSLSFREIDHSYAGSDSTEGFGLTWDIIDDLTFRAKSQVTVRAPNVGELFKPVLEGSSFTSDPCDANNLIECLSLEYNQPSLTGRANFILSNSLSVAQPESLTQSIHSTRTLG